MSANGKGTGSLGVGGERDVRHVGRDATVRQRLVPKVAGVGNVRAVGLSVQPAGEGAVAVAVDGSDGTDEGVQLGGGISSRGVRHCEVGSCRDGATQSRRRVPSIVAGVLAKTTNSLKRQPFVASREGQTLTIMAARLYAR